MSETQRLRWIDEYVGMYVSNGGPLLGSPDIVPTCVEILPRVRAEPPRRPHAIEQEGRRREEAPLAKEVGGDPQ